MMDILVEHEGPIATVVFNRPQMRNAISLAMWTEIARVTEGLAKDDSVRAVVYRGAGRDAFASGADISEFKEHRKDTATALRYNAQTSAAYTAIRECAKPTVAMIFGFCMGGAMAVAMACDLRFAAEGAKFGIPAGRAPRHHLRGGLGRPTRRSRRPRLREGHRVLRTDDRGPGGAGDGFHPTPPAPGRARALHLRLSSEGRRQRAALGARRQGDDRVVPARPHRGAAQEAQGPDHRGDRERGLQGGNARVPREARAQVPGSLARKVVRFEFLTSTPLSPTEGSGTFVALDGLTRGLRDLGHTVTIRPLSARTGFHTLDRWVYNVRVALRPPAADVTLGVDLDGFLWARRRRRGPFVVMLKGIIADELRNERGWVRVLLSVQARWERSNTARADRVVVPSRYSLSVAHAVYGIPDAKLAIVPEPIDLADWRRRFAEAAGARATRPTVLSVARMYPRKRLDDLLRAAVILRERIPDAQVRIVGEGPESARLRALHRELRLRDGVVLLGEVTRPRLAVEYARAHCFCLPTVQEGFGLVFAEAMAAGLPVVACRAAAVPEIVEDRRTGFLVSPRHPGELAAALETLLMSENLREDFGRAAAQRVEAFGLERVARRFLETLP